MFQNEKVKLRAYREEDLEKAYVSMNDYETQRGLMPGLVEPVTWEQQFRWYKEVNQGRSREFAIEENRGGDYVGGCGLKNENIYSRSAQLGVMIIPEFQGRGYGKAATELLLDYGFKEMNLNRMELTVHAFNERAIKLYEGLGFVQEGVLREAVFRDGDYWDTIVMSILRREWE